MLNPLADFSAVNIPRTRINSAFGQKQFGPYVSGCRYLQHNPWTFLRPNGFMQNMVIYNAATVRGQDAFYGSAAEGKVSQIDIRDVGAAAVSVLTENGHLGKTYTLTGPVALSNSEAAAILSPVLGREIRYVNLPRTS
jgi:uncharacterized protein YbjT (DUF2867 family)